MFPSKSDILHRGPQAPRRQQGDRRTRGRLRELWDEVLASYKAARGQDVLTADDRRAAEELLKRLTPNGDPLAGRSEK